MGVLQLRMKQVLRTGKRPGELSSEFYRNRWGSFPSVQQVLVECPLCKRLCDGHMVSTPTDQQRLPSIMGGGRSSSVARL